MSRVLLRGVMAFVGVTLLLFYALAAYVVYQAFVALWALRPDWPVAVASVVFFALLFGYLSYRFGTTQILAQMNAVQLPRERAPNLYRRLDQLCERMDIDRPEVVLARMNAPNALALGGRGNGVLVLDRSLFQLLNADELEGILAHELAHIESHDSFVQTLAFSVIRTTVGLALLIFLPMFLLLTGLSRAIAWIRGKPVGPRTNLAEQVRVGLGNLVGLVFVGLVLVVRAYSRRREFAADDRAAEVTGKPIALARALKKIERAATPQWGLFSPLSIRHGDESLLRRLLATHPSMDERIERLVEQAEERSGKSIRIQ